MPVKTKKGGRGKIGEPVKAPKGKYIHVRQVSPTRCKLGSYSTITTKEGDIIRTCIDKKTGKRITQSILKKIKKN